MDTIWVNGLTPTYSGDRFIEPLFTGVSIDTTFVGEASGNEINSISIYNSRNSLSTRLLDSFYCKAFDTLNISIHK
jgi:hypothetical protein